jgi:hypothetical protein
MKLESKAVMVTVSDAIDALKPEHARALTAAHSALLKDVVCAFREKLTPDVVQEEIDSSHTF